MSFPEIRLIKALRNPCTPTVSIDHRRGMADSALYSDCKKRAASERHRWARANEHLVASNFRRAGATARRQERKGPEDVTGQAVKESRGPGFRRSVRLESRRLGQASARDSNRDSNLARAGSGAVGKKRVRRRKQAGRARTSTAQQPNCAWFVVCHTQATTTYITRPSHFSVQDCTPLRWKTSAITTTPGPHFHLPYTSPQHSSTTLSSMGVRQACVSYTS